MSEGKEYMDEFGFIHPKEEISLDILMLRDRHYFEIHPDCAEYIREMVPGEFVPYYAGVVLFAADGSEYKYTLVRKAPPKYPGLRFRFMMSEKEFQEATHRGFNAT